MKKHVPIFAALMVVAAALACSAPAATPEDSTTPTLTQTLTPEGDETTEPTDETEPTEDSSEADPTDEPDSADPTTAPTDEPSAGPAPGSDDIDLYIGDLTLSPATPVEGEPVDVSFRIYNGGDDSPSGTIFTTEWWAGSSYSDPACEWDIDIDDIPAGTSLNLTCTYPGYPSWYSSIDTLIVVDSTDTIAETNEANNSYAETISVSQAPTPEPDLFVSEFSLTPATPVQGQPVDVRIGVYNQGDAAISGTTFTIEWYAGENFPSPACDWDLDGMAAGGGRILTCTYSGYPSWYGSINTLVVVDSNDTITESDETNNTLLENISVTQASTPKPDLFVSEFSLTPATPVEGEEVQVRIGVYNQGNAAVSGTTFTIEWYPGENFPSPACSWNLNSMNANGGRILTCTYSGYPSWYGSINTLVVVDANDTVDESNEGNNTLLENISVSQN